MGLIVFDIFIACLAILVVHTIFEQVGNLTYDVRQIRLKKLQLEHPYTASLLKRPKISIIIPVHNASNYISDCLGSIIKSSYRNYEIIVVNDASDDNSREIINTIITNNPKQSIKLINKRQKSGWISAAKSIKSTVMSGEIVLLLGADSYLFKDSLKLAVRQFNSTNCEVLLTNHEVKYEQTTLNILKQASQMVIHKTTKLFAVLNILPARAPINCFLTKQTFRQLRRYKNPNMLFASDVKIYSAAHTYYTSAIKLNVTDRPSKIINAVYLTSEKLLFVGGVVVNTYFIYIGLHLAKPEFYFLGWAIVSIWLALAIISTNQSLRNKLRLLLFTPVMYGVFYVYAFVWGLKLIIKSLISFLIAVKNYFMSYKQTFAS